MQMIVEELATSLKVWAEGCQAIQAREAIPISMPDRSNSNEQIDDIFFARGLDLTSLSGKDTLTMAGYQELQTGTLRNSFYTSIFARHTDVRDVQFRIVTRGDFEVTLFSSATNSGVKNLKKLTIKSSEDGEPVTTTARVRLEGEAGKNARLFWSGVALHDNAQILDASWDAIAPSTVDGKMLVVLRTFGRTLDILDLLASFEEQSQGNPAYQRALRNIKFVVLDTSAGLTPESYSLCSSFEHVDSFAFEGPNMGGGGNMSQILLVIEDAVERSGVSIDEMLLLDDDLSISMETLYRHWASVLFRTDNTLFTLPVFTKSEPRRMWEDGAFWGRFLDADCQPDRKSIAPRLIRHNYQFEGYKHLDELAVPNYPEYCTFIFLSLPYTQFKKLGFPLAFFLRGDDIEYSLRHNRSGGKIMSNPNLTAWHEPAHSYGQEYMSISHGIIINMAYGQDKADDFVSFFQKRALAHTSVSDARGIELYTEVLRDLNSRDVFLEHNFKDHYVQKLGFFKKFDAEYEHLPAEVQRDVIAKAEKRGQPIVRSGFLYMPVAAQSEIAQVMLENPHTETVRLYRTKDKENLTALTKALSAFYAALAQFDAEYDAIKAHYGERVERSTGRTFWLDEMEVSKGDLRILARSEFLAAAE